MRQAIVTKFFGPTDTRGSRIKATCYGGSVTIPYDHALNVDQNHEQAAWTLMRKMKHGSPQDRICRGGTPDGKGYVFILCAETES